MTARAPAEFPPMDELPLAPRTELGADVWISGLLLFMLLLIGIGTLPVSRKWHDAQSLDFAVRHPPSFRPVVPIDRYARDQDRGWLTRSFYATTSWFGHDDLGRSLMYRVLPASLVSLGIGLAAALTATVVGTLWGATAALAGGRLDSVLMRVVDALYGLPYLLLVILLKTALTRPMRAMFSNSPHAVDLVIMFLAVGGVSWLTLARIVRGQVLSLKGELFVEASRAAGTGSWGILRRHILPNVAGPISVYATLVVPQAVMQESFLSFLGIGVQQPVPSLGRLAAEGVESVNMFVAHWWLLVFPGLVLAATLLSLNFLGDGLRRAIDPRSDVASLV